MKTASLLCFVGLVFSSTSFASKMQNCDLYLLPNQWQAVHTKVSPELMNQLNAPHQWNLTARVIVRWFDYQEVKQAMEPFLGDNGLKFQWKSWGYGDSFTKTTHQPLEVTGDSKVVAAFLSQSVVAQATSAHEPYFTENALKALTTEQPKTRLQVVLGLTEEGRKIIKALVASNKDISVVFNGLWNDSPFAFDQAIAYLDKTNVILEVSPKSFKKITQKLDSRSYVFGLRPAGTPKPNPWDFGSDAFYETDKSGEI